MTKLHTLLASTAMIAFAAIPAQALVLDADVTLGLYTAGMVPTIDPNDSVGAATGDGSASVPSNEVVPDDVDAAVTTDDSTGPATGDGANTEVSEGTVDPEVRIEPGESTGAATGDNVASASAPAASAAVSLDTVLIAESEFKADDVVDASGVQIGVVENVIKQSEAETTLIVLVNGGMIDESRFTIGINDDLVSDGTLQLSMTTEELVAALAAL